MTKIYTKTGDGGTTATFKGRIRKSDQLAVAIGSIDEINSWVGHCRSECGQFSLQCGLIEKELRVVQKNLLTIGSALAGSGLRISATETKRLEKLIDKLTGELPKLANFIYPTGVGPAAVLQVARSVCRRAERETVRAEVTNKNILTYLNRLSDGLFTMARWVNWKLGGVEEVWSK